MNREKVKNWIKEHKYELIGFTIGSVSGVVIFKCGYNIGINEGEKIHNNLTKKLLRDICPEVNKYYIVKRTGDFKGITYNNYDDFEELVEATVNVMLNKKEA